MTKLFKKRLRKVVKRGMSERKIANIIEDLKNGPVLSTYHKAHKLKGEFLGTWELHIVPNLLLIYAHHEDVHVLHLVDIGTHTELFG